MTQKLRCLVCTTSSLAIPSLEALHQSGHDLVVLLAKPNEDSDGIFSESDDTGVQQWAEPRGVEVQQLTDHAPEALPRAVEKLRPDLGIVVDYGRVFPESLLEIPTNNWIKLHFSQLPKHRGFHPVRSALWHGDRSTGVSIIEMGEEPDKGPILAKESVPIESDETFGNLSARLAHIGAPLLVDTVDSLALGKKIKPRTQNEKSSSTTLNLTPRHCQAPWWREAKIVLNHLRALSPSPGMTTMMRRKRVRIVKGGPMGKMNAPPGESGTFIGTRAGQLAVLCSKGSVFGIELAEWPEGNSISAHELVKELDVKVGDLFV
jgi:methionyl-tRNA formyltransferase